jgi:hypothetical protein
MKIGGPSRLAKAYPRAAARPKPATTPGCHWLKREGANPMPQGSPPLIAICRGVGPLLCTGVPACGVITTPTNATDRDGESQNQAFLDIISITELLSIFNHFPIDIYFATAQNESLFDSSLFCRKASLRSRI